MDDGADTAPERIWRVSALGKQAAWWFVVLGVAGFLVVVVMWAAADDDVELVFLVVTYVVLVVPFMTMAAFAALRPYVAPWSTIAGVTPGYSELLFETRETGTITAWAVQKSNLATWRNREPRADRVAKEIGRWREKRTSLTGATRSRRR